MFPAFFVNEALQKKYCVSTRAVFQAILNKDKKLNNITAHASRGHSYAEATWRVSLTRFEITKGIDAEFLEQIDLTLILNLFRTGRKAG